MQRAFPMIGEEDRSNNPSKDTEKDNTITHSKRICNGGTSMLTGQNTQLLSLTQ